ncbi:Nucleolar complex protein 3-like [Porphyridium purpureum]|uniref:Nucleolar complex protein 3-like n=1 Tax=Porphyridium purpureum TaxID=35688 RepID=A0A5J4YZ76_PORPP|nr:Nucleolar complex protein 3-like [Porphyridium purpureum]|eukprot:POR5516..scf209_3
MGKRKWDRQDGGGRHEDSIKVLANGSRAQRSKRRVGSDEDDEAHAPEFERKARRMFTQVAAPEAPKRMPVLDHGSQSFIKESQREGAPRSAPKKKALVQARPVEAGSLVAVEKVAEQEERKRSDRADSHSKPVHRENEDKNAIAKLAMLLTSDPEKHVKLFNQFSTFYGATNKSKLVRQLAMLTEAHLFMDLCPAYAIRALTEAEASVKVSKDVARVRNFEQSLLLAYGRFLARLIDFVKGIDSRSAGGHARSREGSATGPIGVVKKQTIESIGVTAMTCLSRMLVSLAHFNESSKLATFVCSYLGHRIAAVRDAASEAVGELLGAAHLLGGQALETCVVSVRAISEMARKHGVSTKASLLEPFLRLKLRSMQTFGTDKSRETLRKIKKARSKKLTKSEESARLDAELERDLREMEARASPEDQMAAKREILKHVSLTYFRILSSVSLSASGDGLQAYGHGAMHKPPCLDIILHGIEDMVGLINSDVLKDLLDALNPFFASNTLKVSVVLNCLHAAYRTNDALVRTAPSSQTLEVQTVNANGEQESTTTNFDFRELDVRLYECARRIMEEPKSCTVENVLLLLETIGCALDQRKVTAVRRAAFARRLFQMSMFLDQHCCNIGTLAAGLAVLPHSGWPECVEAEDQITLGAYSLSQEDPDSSGALDSMSWELFALCQHWHPKVAELARSKYKKKPCARVAEAIPLMLAHDSRSCGFNPPPLQKKVGK